MSGMNSRTGMIPGRHRRLGVSGCALNDGSVWNYGYDGKNQLVTAIRGSQNAMTYAYDGIGNRTAATEDGTEMNYTANLLNQYTAINAEAPTYDADGNMQTNAGWTYTWNNDNRLVKAEKESARVEFSYDYMGRRMFKKVYASNTLVKHEKYVYDGYKLVAIYDGLNSDALLKTFIWQPISLDVPLCMTAGGVTYYYLTDGNKNVIGLYDSTGTQVAAYTYGPFGQLLSSTGTAAMENPFRFSSEFHDDETGLVYYNYRYYDPKLGRWTKRDPIGIEGGMNLYIFLQNSQISSYDYVGLYSWGYDPSTQFDPNHDHGMLPQFPNPEDYYNRDEDARRNDEERRTKEDDEFPYTEGAYGKIYGRPLWHYPKTEEGMPCDVSEAIVVNEPRITNIQTSLWTVTMDSQITVNNAKDLTWAWTTCWRGGEAGFFKVPKNSSFSLNASPMHSPIKFTVEYLWLSCECADGEKKKWIKKRAVKGGALWAKNLWTGWRVSVSEGVF